MQNTIFGYDSNPKYVLSLFLISTITELIALKKRKYVFSQKIRIKLKSNQTLFEKLKNNKGKINYTSIAIGKHKIYNTSHIAENELHAVSITN